MACGFTDLIEIVVLTAGTYTFLRGDGARVITFFVAEKHVFELIHPGVDKQQRRVVCGQ